MRIRLITVLVILLINTLVIMAESSAQERQMGGVGITVFNDRNFGGKSATFRQDVPDLESQ